MIFQREGESDFLTLTKCQSVTKKTQKNETDFRIALNLNISLHWIYIKQDLYHSQTSCPQTEEVTDLYPHPVPIKEPVVAFQGELINDCL